MTVAASPWDALLRVQHPVRLSEQAATPAREAKPATKLAGLLALLARSQSLTTLAIAFECDLTPNQVWGLLKAPRASGQVRFEDGRWSLAFDFPGRDVQRAVELLRSKGWRVERPIAK